ncbi:arylesterase [Sneathiella limimaris]|uniref:arylesterase n=1 Tax=Sneathiella limimaris TaxID=1964213 RepID=UPI00146B8059|nr:arylesterase [Sneathiella limimaris]
MQLKYPLQGYGKLPAIFNSFCLLFLLVLWNVGASANEPKTIVAIGDSLTAGYGLPEEEAFTTQLETALVQAGLNIKVENAGVSGDTSTGGLQRLEWALASGADYVFLELGANDALRGIEPEVTRENLNAIIQKIQGKNIPIFLAGMKAPPNMGEDYRSEFDQIYPDLAQKYNVGFYPFFLEGVASIAELNQDDAIHPNKEGVAVIVKNMLPSLSEFLKSN